MIKGTTGLEEINIQSLSKGVYFVQIEDSASAYKFIKE